MGVNMEPILATCFFVCLSCLVGIAALALLLFLIRGNLRGGIFVRYASRGDADVIDVDYTISDESQQTTTPYTVDVDAGADEITVYPLDD